MKIIKNFIKSIFVITFAAVACILGYFAGTQINDKHFKIDKYANLTREYFMEDVSKIKYKGKSPDSFTPVETYLIALTQSTSKDYNKVIMGTVEISIGLTQNITVASSRHGDTYSFSSCTYSSMFKNALRSSYKKNEDLKIQKGSVSTPNLEDVVWNDDYDHYTYDEYTSLIGREVTYESQYIVSSKTVKESYLIKKENNLYTYKMILDPFYATFTYVNEISHNSGIDKNTITFNSVEFECVIDSNFNLIRQTSSESYRVKYSGIPVNVGATFEITMTY